MKLDMHCHTHEGSPDAKISIEDYIIRLKEQGFQGMLVTDHDSYGGYRYYEENLKGKIGDFVVLKGVEYDTLDAGHIIVVMPSSVDMPLLEIKGLPLRVLIKLVHSNGGILGPAHACGEPFLSCFSTGKYRRDISVAAEFDFIEGYNCGEDDEANKRARHIAFKYNKPVTGGSDAHNYECVGMAYTTLSEDIKTEDDFIAYIKAGKTTRCGGKQYMGTLKQKLGRWNKLLVYGFWPYNKAGAAKNAGRRRVELLRQQHELIVGDLMESEPVQRMNDYIQHGAVTTLEHCREVMLSADRLSRYLGHKRLDRRAMLRGALLHDLYLYDWHEEGDGTHHLHGFHHADRARENAVKHFGIGKKEQSIIHSHMWPLNITRVPKVREAWIVCLADKYVSTKETLFMRHKSYEGR